MFRYIVIIAAFTALNVLSAAAAESAAGGEIVIGATFPLSGDLEYYGQSAYYGATTRVKMINDAGGIKGKQLVVKWRDNKSDPAIALKDVQDLVEEFNVAAILGPLMSDSAVQMHDYAKEKQLVFMSPMASSDAVVQKDGWVFRACFSNTAQAQGMIKFQMDSYGAKSCAILFDPRHQFSAELAGVFERAFRAAGGKVVGILSIINYFGEKDYQGPLKKLAAYSPDFIYAPCYGLEAAELIHAARDTGVGTRFAGPLTWDNELVFNASGRRLAGTSISSSLFEKTYNYHPYQEFYQAMEQAGMDLPDAMAACAYDAVSLLAEGLKNGETGEKIRQGLFRVRRFPLATGVTAMRPSGDLKKPVVIRFIEQRSGHMVPVFADLFDPE